jgi:hypothetical protein
MTHVRVGCLKFESGSSPGQAKRNPGWDFKLSAGVCGSAVDAVIYVIYARDVMYDRSLLICADNVTYAERVTYACGHPSRRPRLRSGSSG